MAKPEVRILDVAVIGGGLSGLTCARDLRRAGCDSFVVLEARDRVGGRTYDHHLGHGVVSEGGGQWIGPGQSAIAELAGELGIDTFDTFYRGKTVYLAGDARVAQDVAGRSGVDPRIVGKLDELARGVPSSAPWKAANASHLDRLSVEDWLATQELSEEDRIGFVTFATLTFGAPPAEMSLLHFLSGIHSSNCSFEQLESIKGGAQERRFVGGSQRLSIELAKDLADRVELSSPVRKVVGWDRDVVEVHTERGIVRARHVIAALSPCLCNRIAFDPALPEGRAEMQRLWPAHSRMRKTAHVYPRPFWREAGLNGQVVQVDGPLIWAYDNSPPDGAVGVINAFVRPEALPRDPEQAKSILSAIYAQALGEAALSPTQFHDLDWGEVDSWTLTCTSPMPPGFLTKWGDFLHPPLGRLIWSGTETADVWAGAMDGAVRSGHRAAMHALRALARG